MLNKLFSYKLVAVMLTVFLLAVPLLGCAGDAGRKGGEEKGAPPEASAGYEEAEARLLELLAPLPQAGGDYKIAALLITLANPFWITMKEGYEAAAREYGVHVDVLSAPKEDDVNSQLEALQTVLAKDYDAVALSAITPYNLVPGVAEATRKGIPVIAVGTSVDAEAAEAAGARIEAFITSDFAKQGEIGAQYIIDKIGSGKVAVIEGLPGAAQGEARKNGARQAFENDNNIELVSVQPGNWDRRMAYDITASLIQAHPDIKGIFCANDVMALGAVEALQAAGKKKDVIVVGVDFIDEARKSIRRGELDGTVAMSPFLFGKGGLILALKVLEGHELREDIYWTPLGLVHGENLSAFEGWK
jgi:ABC-type sugar transport system substrate-binding protein